MLLVTPAASVLESNGRGMVAGRSQRCRASPVRNRGDQAPPKRANSTQAATTNKGKGLGLNRRIRGLRERGRRSGVREPLVLSLRFSAQGEHRDAGAVHALD